MRIVAKTDKGHVRDSNQDAYAVGEFSIYFENSKLPSWMIKYFLVL